MRIDLKCNLVYLYFHGTDYKDDSVSGDKEHQVEDRLVVVVGSFLESCILLTRLMFLLGIHYPGVYSGEREWKHVGSDHPALV